MTLMYVCLACGSVVARSLVMAEAGTNLVLASDNLLATEEQRHFLSVGFNTHMATGPVVRWMAFRHRKGGQRRRSKSGAGAGGGGGGGAGAGAAGGVSVDSGAGGQSALPLEEPAPWHPVSYYERRSKHVTTTLRKTRSECAARLTASHTPHLVVSGFGFALHCTAKPAC